jgi:peptide/nickel transport system permease protein
LTIESSVFYLDFYGFIRKKGIAMYKFVLSRVLMMIPVLLGVALVVFTMLYFTPGDASDFLLGDDATAVQKEMLRHELMLDQPFFIQFGNYLNKVFLHGDFGTSYATREPVITQIFKRFPTTLLLSVLCISFATIVGITAGIISATKQYSIFDTLVTGISMLGVSMPVFWLGLMMIILFSVKLGWLPPSGFSSPIYWLMPMITASTNDTATIMRMTRSSMLEVIRQDYIRTARAKGQKEIVVIIYHALRNALIPIITVIGLSFGFLLGGSVLTESIFSIAGVGKLMIDSLKVRDVPIIQGVVLFIALVVCIVNVITDVIYAYVDPRIRSQYVSSKKKKA